MGKWLIPDGDAPNLTAVTVRIPAGSIWASRFWGAFALLAADHNWEETATSTLTPAETASLWIDGLFAGIQEANSVIIGTIVLWGATEIPDGWLECDGQWLAQAEYPDLFAVIGSTFGSLGSSFQVPDLGGRFPIGETYQYDLAEEGGYETHNLTLDEMPEHTHELYVKATVGGAADAVEKFTKTQGAKMETLPEGTGNQHNNMPPYLGLYFIIKAEN